MPGMFDVIQYTRAKPTNLIKGLSSLERIKSYMGYMRLFCLILSSFLKKIYCGIR